MNKLVLAADLGGTNLRMAAVDKAGNICYRTRQPTPDSENADAIVQAIKALAENCRANTVAFGEIESIGICVPGGVKYETGTIIRAPNVPCLDEFPMASAVSEVLHDLPVILENDANAYAIGEQTFGAAKGFSSAIAVTLGTGVGGGIVIDGKILRGIDGMAGEIGHICVEPLGVKCKCSNDSRGCIEQYASATAIVRMAHELKEKYPDSALTAISDITSQDVYDAAKTGDLLSIEVFRLMGTYLGIALSNLINCLNPEIIVIGGGASAGWDLFIDHVNGQIANRSYRVSAKRAKIVRAICGDDAGILGVAKLAFEVEKNRSL
jgi:glucokinase